MASAVFRVKRRLDDQPYEKFVLNCKRIKLDDENGTNIAKTALNDQKSIIKFAATLNADDDISAHLDKLQKPEASENFHKARKPTNVVEKLREQMKNDAKNQRFKILSNLREVDSNGSANNEENSRIRVIDVEKEDYNVQQAGSSNENKPAAAESSDKFVYDLYLVDGADAEQLDVDNIESIKPFDDLILQLYSEILDDADFLSDDSNDEDNWRNEYPDTDDGASIGDDDMRRAVEDLNFGNDADELSSDNENMAYTDEPPVHFIDTKNGGNDESDNDDDYDYFKKHGRIKQHADYYRPNRSFPTKNNANDDDSDEDGCASSIRSSSSASSASDLLSCDDDDNN